MCASVNANERKVYKQRQCLHLDLNTMFTTRLPNFSIATKTYLTKVKTPCLSQDQKAFIAQEKIKRIAKLINQPNVTS